MQAAQMDELIEAHLKAESAGDTAGAVAVYTDDVEHDVVGSPTGPLKGKGAAQGFYEYLTQNLTTENQTCAFDNLSCFTSFTPHMVYSGAYYWQVSVVSPVQASSPVWMFTGEKPVDRTPPRVRALPGAAVRGKTAFFSARVSDDSGEVRMRAELSYQGHPVIGGDFGYARVSWSQLEQFWSKHPLDRSLPAGTYRSCLTVWDRAGNSARSCAAYRVR